jgi:hypothetical protein
MINAPRLPNSVLLMFRVVYLPRNISPLLLLFGSRCIGYGTGWLHLDLISLYDYMLCKWRQLIHKF